MENAKCHVAKPLNQYENIVLKSLICGHLISGAADFGFRPGKMF